MYLSEVFTAAQNYIKLSHIQICQIKQGDQSGIDYFSREKSAGVSCFIHCIPPARVSFSSFWCSFHCRSGVVNVLNFCIFSLYEIWSMSNIDEATIGDNSTSTTQRKVSLSQLSVGHPANFRNFTSRLKVLNYAILQITVEIPEHEEDNLLQFLEECGGKICEGKSSYSLEGKQTFRA